MLVGYIGARRGMLGPDFARGASKLTLNVFMSATILQSVINNPPELSGPSDRRLSGRPDAAAEKGTGAAV